MNRLNKFLAATALGAMASVTLAATPGAIAVDAPAGIALACDNVQNVAFLTPAPREVLERYAGVVRAVTGRTPTYGGAASFEVAKRFVAEVQQKSKCASTTMVMSSQQGQPMPVYWSGDASMRYVVRADSMSNFDFTSPAAKVFGLDGTSKDIKGLYWLEAYVAGQAPVMYGPYTLTPEYLRAGKGFVLPVEDVVASK